MSNKNRPIMPSIPFGGDDCDRPACDDVKDAMAKSGLQLERTKRQPNFATKGVVTMDCPVNTAQLGRSSWTLLHSMVSHLFHHTFSLITSQLARFVRHDSHQDSFLNKAAWYPDSPSKQDQTTMIQFINALARFYPCTHCAADFQHNVIETPVT